MIILGIIQLISLAIRRPNNWFHLWAFVCGFGQLDWYLWILNVLLLLEARGLHRNGSRIKPRKRKAHKICAGLCWSLTSTENWLHLGSKDWLEMRSIKTIWFDAPLLVFLVIYNESWRSHVKLTPHCRTPAPSMRVIATAVSYAVDYMNWVHHGRYPRTAYNFAKYV